MAHWTKEEINILWEMAGVRPVGSIAKRLGRSVSAVTEKAQREGVKLFQGTYTIRQLCVKLGADPTTVWRICKRLGLRVKRRVSEGGRGYTMISEDQAWNIAAAYQVDLDLRAGWAMNYAACVSCGRTDRKHAARGLCVRCYDRERTIQDKEKSWHERLRAVVSQVMDGLADEAWDYGILEFSPGRIRGVMEADGYAWTTEIRIPESEIRKEETEEEPEAEP